MRPKVKPDPELLQQQQAARLDKQGAIRDRVTSITDALIRLYGTRSALAGTKGRAPILGR